MRFLLLLVLPVMLLATACGDDDDDSATRTPTEEPNRSVEASRSPTPTAEAVETATDDSTITDSPTPFESEAATRRAGITADLFAESTTDLFGTLRGHVPENVPCPYDADEVVIDCSDEGFGRIALDREPTGEISQCQAVTADGELLAVSCNTTEPSLWFYKIVG